MLPLVFVCADVLLERRKIGRDMFLDKVPFFLLSLAFGIVALEERSGRWRERSGGDGPHGREERHLLLGETDRSREPELLYPWRGEISVTQPGFFVPLILTIACSA